MRWHPWPKYKLGDCFIMGKYIYPSKSNSTNSVFPNHQPQSKQITPRPKASSPLRLDKKFQGSGYSILLDEGQGLKQLCSLLEPSNSKHGGLLQKKITHHIAIEKSVLLIYIWKMPYLKSTIRSCKNGKIPYSR